MTSDNSTTYHACTNLISGSKEVTDVNGAAAFLALILFLIYFYFQVTSLQLLQQVIPVLFVDDMLEPNESDATSAALMKGQKSSSDFSAPVPTSTSPPAPTLNHQIATTMGTYRVCKFVILVCVEIVGLWMIFNSTSNHEVIINSTAAFFLCELDAYVLNCIVQHYLLVEPVTGEFDTELVNIEFSTNDLGEYFKKLEQDRLEKEKKANAINPVN